MTRIITLISRTSKPYAVVLNAEHIIMHNLFSKTVKKKISLYFSPVNVKNSKDSLYFACFFIHFSSCSNKNTKKTNVHGALSHTNKQPKKTKKSPDTVISRDFPLSYKSFSSFSFKYAAGTAPTTASAGSPFLKKIILYINH